MNRKLRFALISLMIVLILALPAAVFAESSEGSFSEEDYAAIVYDPSRGMPFSEANVSIQTRDGFIYMGSYGGLTRYDGRQFERIEGVSSGVALFEDSRGRLWVGTSEMGAVCLVQDELTVYGTAEGLPSSSVRWFAEEDNGDIIMATRSGLACLTSDGTLYAIDEENTAGKYINMISRDDQGRIYVVNRNEGIVTLIGKKAEYVIPTGDFGAEVSFVYPDPGRADWVYLGTEGSEVLHGCIKDDPSSFERMQTDGVSGVNWIVAQDDILWVCGGDGVGYFSPDGSFTKLKHIPVTNAFESLMTDREGNLWFSSSRRGVMKLSRSVFSDYSAMAGLDAQVVNSVLHKNGLLFIGSDSGLTVVDDDLNTVLTPVSELLSGARVRSVTEDKYGHLWFSTYSSSGLVYYDPLTAVVKTFTEDDGLASDQIRDTLPLSDGSLLVSSANGFYRISGGEVARSYSPQVGVGETMVLCMCAASDGKVYLGCDGAGLYVLEKDSVRRFDGENPLTSGYIISLTNDEENGGVWIITGSYELAFLKDGAIRVFGELPQAMKDAHPYYGLLTAENGSLWLLGGCGVCRFDGKALLAGETPKTVYYGTRSGLPHVSAVYAHNYVDKGGTAYLAGADGVTVLHMNADTVSRSVPQIRVPYVDIDGTRQWIKDGEPVVLSSGTRRIVIHPAVLSYTLDDPGLEYRLEGFDSEKSAVRLSELQDVSYTNLPDGEYTFRIALKDRDDVPGFSFVIEQEKRWYEYTVIHILFVAAFLLIAAFSISSILLRHKNMLERKTEEARIDTELSMASNIQADLLPNDFPAFPDRTEFGIYASMEAAKEVGGDFYDFFLTDEDHLALVTGDVNGKGVPAALFMTLSKTLIKSIAMSHGSPAEVLEVVNEKLCEDFGKSMFVTVWLGILEISTGILTWADAGSRRPLRRSGGSWAPLDKNGGAALYLVEPELLKKGGDEPFADQRLQLQHGDILFAYTDGLTESQNRERELFGEERLKAALNNTAEDDPEAVIAGVREELRSFTGNAQQADDMTMLCLRYK